MGLDLLDRREQWPIGLVRPYVEHAVASFGPQRLMMASNWPVSLVSATYQQIWDDAAELFAPLTSAGREAVLGGTAARFYDLPTALGAPTDRPDQ